MTLKELANKLRKTAEMLDELVGINLDKPTKNENNKTAKKIMKSIKKRKKLHWTQMPKNRKKMLSNLKKAAKAQV